MFTHSILGLAGRLINIEYTKYNMGIIIGTFGLIIGLLFILFPKIAMNIFRLKGKGFHKESGKTKFEIARPPLYKLTGEKNSIMIYRIVGIILVIISIFAYLSSNSP